MAADTALNHPNAVCVFCGSASGNSPAYIEAAQRAGRAIARSGACLVYGGGRVGLMGAVADAALGVGGRVVGVMPKALVDREIAHASLTELHQVADMHERKAKMSEMAAAFLVLPGGAGTLEEAFEQWTWAQIGVHAKPLGFLNVEGYFDPLLSMVDAMVRKGFVAKPYRDALIVSDSPEEILRGFANYVAPGRKTYEPVRTGGAALAREPARLKPIDKNRRD